MMGTRKRDRALIDAIDQLVQNELVVTKVTIETLGGTPEVIYKEKMPDD